MSGFFKACVHSVFHGSKAYGLWVGGLSIGVLVGVGGYGVQFVYGLSVTGMTDQVIWGAYIANFTFLVGVAAAAVMLVIPAYIFHRKDAKTVVLLGEGIAVAACTMALLFVVADLGRPDRFWHMIPFIGRFNFPMSLLSWDVVVLTGYLGLNLSIPTYFLYNRYRGKVPEPAHYFWAIVLAIAWAIALHTVTAFLFSSNAGRPFWHTALLGPRFLASAFAAGPATIIIAFVVIDKVTDFKIPPGAIGLLALIATGALQVNLLMLGAEVFTEFYSATAHSASAEYLFVGLHGHHAVVPWIYAAIVAEFIALLILLIRPWRERVAPLLLACLFMVFGVWVEKGMGLIVPGFIPSPLGEVVEYAPTIVELSVSLGIWAFGALVFTVLAKAAIPIELGVVRAEK